MLRFFRKMRRNFLIFCVFVCFCFCQTTPAQSGRRPDKNKPATEQKNVESKRAETSSEKRDEKTPVRILSLKLVGEVQHNFAYYKSNDLENALKEFIFFTKLITKNAPAMTRGDKKLNYTEAKEQAKKETDAFVLWIGFSAKNDNYGNMYIDVIQYAVLKPQSGEVLTRGQFKPGESELGKPDVVVNLPTGRRPIALLEMKNGARELAVLLVRGGWLD